MANQITIDFTPCSPTPSGGWIVFYRPLGSSEPFTEAGPFFSSPAVIVDTEEPDGTQFEGLMFSDCDGSLGNGIPFASTPAPSGGESSGGGEEACLSYTNNQDSAVIDISWTDCDGTPHVDEVVNIGQEICIQPGTLSGGNAGLLTLNGPCGIFFAFSFTDMTDDYSRPFAGSFRWNEQSGGQIVSGVPDPLNYYRRFVPRDFGNTSSGVYDWTKFDDRVKEAIDAGQTFAFGVMFLYPDPDLGGFNDVNEDYIGFDNSTAGANSGKTVVNDWVLDMCQKWVGPSGDWAIYYTDANYAAYIAELFGDIRDHINATSYVPGTGPHNGDTVQFADVIEFVDIRPIGSYGEGHHGNFLNDGESVIDDTPSGFYGSPSDFNALIDAHVNQINDWPLIAIMNYFDHNFFDHTEIPDSVGAHIIATENDWGKLGYRNDHFSDWFPSDDGYYDNEYQQNHPTLSAEIMSRYLEAPVIGEFPGGPVDGECGTDFCEAPDEAEFYHYAMEGNGNFGGSPGANAAVQEGFKVSGHIIRPVSGSCNINDSQIIVSMDWRNFGSAPSYDKSFDCFYVIRDDEASVVFTGMSDFNPFLFAPSGSPTNVTDVFSNPGLAPGNYSLEVIFIDNRGEYRAPFPLGIEGRQSDGSYLLGTFEII